MRTLGDFYKRKKLEEMLAENDIVSVILDARPDAVKLPAHLKGQAGTRIDVGLRLLTLDISDEGVEAELSFRECGIHACFWPWWVVYAFDDHKNPKVVFTESVPLAITIRESAPEEVAPKVAAEKRPALRLVKAEDAL